MSKLFYYIIDVVFTYNKMYDCGEIYLCPHCKIALTYHKYGSFLQCHFCNYINESIPKKCNKCSSYNIELSGTGTQG